MTASWRPCILSAIITILILLTGLHRPDVSFTTFTLPGLLPATSSRLYYDNPNRVHANPELLSSQKRRYAHLRSPPRASKYLFVTATRNIEASLPDLLNTLIVLTTFLGHGRLRFSIYEGPSNDATPGFLRDVLVPMLHRLGIPKDDIVLETDNRLVDFGKVNRIEGLAELRNAALAPLWTKGWGDSTAAVVYFNDVFLKARDVLELLHQHVKAGEAGKETGLTSGLDWLNRHPAYYYDVWVARTMQGELFYPIDQAWWAPSDRFLDVSPSDKEAYEQLRPFQAFASWGGMAVLAPTPFLPPHNLRFRRGREGECAASECELICRDLWEVGWGRVQVVPSVQLGYIRDVAIDIASTVDADMQSLGWPGTDPHVIWQDEPPSQVKCYEWPEVLGLNANVWQNVSWSPPYLSYGSGI